MKFYYNADMNVCADENWVIGYLVFNGMIESEKEALEELRTKHEISGWFECEVSNTTEEKFFIERRLKNENY